MIGSVFGSKSFNIVGEYNGNQSRFFMAVQLFDSKIASQLVSIARGVSFWKMKLLTIKPQQKGYREYSR